MGFNYTMLVNVQVTANKSGKCRKLSTFAFYKIIKFPTREDVLIVIPKSQFLLSEIVSSFTTIYMTKA